MERQHLNKPPIGQFDSSSTLARVIAAALKGEGTVGMDLPARFELAARASALLPAKVRVRLFSQGVVLEAVVPRELEGNQAAAAASWFTSRYGEARRAPAIFLGATNGALAELAAGMRAPWLPQTFLLLVRKSNRNVDDIHAVIAGARELSGPVSRCFPHMIAHQMHNAENDRHNVRRAAYFRMKWQRVPDAYRTFIESRLIPGGTIFIVDCVYKWPALRIAQDHLFQVGGYGGRSSAEIMRQHGLSGDEWTARSEAEWGYDGAMTNDVLELAQRRGYKVVRLVFDHPQDLSPAVSRFFRARAPQPDRLVVTNFNMLAASHVLRTGSVPYWSVFNDRKSLEKLGEFLRASCPFSQVDTFLFQNGVVAEGQASARHWRATIEANGGCVRLLGTQEDQHPFDFAAFSHFKRQLQQLEAGVRETPYRPIDPEAAVSDLGHGELKVELMI